ncbi:MAG TPA: DNA gyrase modulator, partial [Novimethylophilus sp.]|uniref:PmbA/TldA family metallopeptidase n=1 Tax=Novimethylophilus sp. TaxID=2137426 RepID=UPI002F415FCB
MKPDTLPAASSPEPGTLFAVANSALLTPYGLDYPALQSVLGGIMTHRVDYADLYFQYSRAESWGLEEGQVKSGSFNIDQGVGVRAVSGEKTAFAYSDDISLPALTQAAEATRAIAIKGDTGSAGAVMRRGGGAQLYLPHDPIASLSDDQKVKLLERLEGYARALDPRVTQVTASLAAEYEVVLIARFDGMMAADIRPLVRVSIQVIAEQDSRR